MKSAQGKAKSRKLVSQLNVVNVVVAVVAVSVVARRVPGPDKLNWPPVTASFQFWPRCIVGSTWL